MLISFKVHSTPLETNIDDNLKQLESNVWSFNLNKMESDLSSSYKLNDSLELSNYELDKYFGTYTFLLGNWKEGEEIIKQYAAKTDVELEVRIQTLYDLTLFKIIEAIEHHEDSTKRKIISSKALRIIGEMNDLLPRRSELKKKWQKKIWSLQTMVYLFVSTKTLAPDGFHIPSETVINSGRYQTYHFLYDLLQGTKTYSEQHYESVVIKLENNQIFKNILHFQKYLYFQHRDQKQAKKALDRIVFLSNINQENNKNYSVFKYKIDNYLLEKQEREYLIKVMYEKALKEQRGKELTIEKQKLKLNQLALNEAEARSIVQSLQVEKLTTKEQLAKQDIQLKNQELLLNENTIKTQQSNLEKAAKEIKFNQTVSLIIAISITAFFGLAYFLYRNTQRKKRVELNYQLLDLKHKSLQLQLNPHFIFNALATLNTVINKNQLTTAKKGLFELSGLMRGILQSSRQSEVQIDDEIKTLKAFLELNKTIGLKDFEYEIIVDDFDPEDYCIPPMLIQPILENAIKHGINSTDLNGKITLQFSIKETHLEISVTDNGIGRNSNINFKKEKGLSVSTKIIEERLQKLHAHDNYFEIVDLTKPSGTKVILRAPIINAWD